MKKMNKLTVAAMVLAAISFASTAASAQTVTTNPGDAILSFQVAGNPTDIEVDLGAASLFSGNSYVNLTSLINPNDLSTIFGSPYSTSAGTGVQWSVVAQVGGAGGSNLDLTSISGLPNAKATNNLSGTYGAIGMLQNGSGGIQGAPYSSSTYSAEALIGNSTTPNSSSSLPSDYYAIQPTLAGFNTGLEQTGAGTDEFYQYVGTSKPSTSSVVDLGTFTLSDTGGNFAFYFGTPTATPEPSAYALGICAVLLFVVLRRRQMIA